MKSLLALVLVVGCGGTEPPAGSTPDAPSGTDGPAGSITLPSWQLEDVQPLSPRSGEVYGLDTFSGKIVVVSLLEGF